MDRTSSTGGDGMDDAIPPALTAILAEMRREAGAQTNPSPLYRYADRIESEVRRAHEEWEAVARVQDKAQTVMMEEIEKLRAPGSVPALRDAILAIKSVNDRRPHDADGYEINDIIKEALAQEKRGSE